MPQRLLSRNEHIDMAVECAKDAADYAHRAELQEAIRSLSEGLYHAAVAIERGDPPQ